MCWFEPYKNGCLLRIKLAPSAAKNAFGAEVFVDVNAKEYLKVSVVAVPEKGKANKELLKMLAKSLKMGVSDFEIIGGQTDHLKKIFINLPLDAKLEQKLTSLKRKK